MIEVQQTPGDKLVIAQLQATGNININLVTSVTFQSFSVTTMQELNVQDWLSSTAAGTQALAQLHLPLQRGSSLRRASWRGGCGRGTRTSLAIALLEITDAVLKRQRDTIRGRLMSCDFTNTASEP